MVWKIKGRKPGGERKLSAKWKWKKERESIGFEIF